MDYTFLMILMKWVYSIYKEFISPNCSQITLALCYLISTTSHFNFVKFLYNFDFDAGVLKNMSTFTVWYQRSFNSSLGQSIPSDKKKKNSCLTIKILKKPFYYINYHLHTTQKCTYFIFLNCISSMSAIFVWEDRQFSAFP